jgi:hypothetical protein
MISGDIPTEQTLLDVVDDVAEKTTDG